MSANRARRSPARSTGPVTQIGNVRGDVHISTSPGVSWPVHVGVVPPQADWYQDRPTTRLTGLAVLRGMGGVGKVLGQQRSPAATTSRACAGPQAIPSAPFENWKNS
ncbi:hypothetical protein [Lentzea atacamensis]|uniref:hypothetical protein n=1 Tax=Lentzea atacamensis TaxID=531938 RepID=UPI000D6C423D|nr:hypothetical protein [Lentzea atacamensis]